MITRYDKRSGERIGIQPQEEKGAAPARWNWDSPFIISPHSHTRLYFGAQVLYRSDDRGNSWKIVSPDLTRQLDRNALAVMGKVWGPDAVAKNTSTALYGNISAVAESPKKEGLLYVGTDDGVVQISEDGGAHWDKVERLPGVPGNAYIARIRASQHDAATVYVVAENHQNGDFTPYLAKSRDMGKTWESVAGDLPARGSTYAIAEDHVDPRLLFAGTEFGAYWSKDGGQHWGKIAGVPTIAVREIVIQKRENDLVLGTFGRGIYIVDDYSAVRATTPETLNAASTLYPVRDALLYVQTLQYGMKGKGFQGETFFNAPNPPYGAVFTYRLKDGLKTLKQKRDGGRGRRGEGRPGDHLPDAGGASRRSVGRGAGDSADGERRQRARRCASSPDRSRKGIQRVAWDLRATGASAAAQSPARRARGAVRRSAGRSVRGAGQLQRHAGAAGRRRGDAARRPGVVQRRHRSAGGSLGGGADRALAIRSEAADAAPRPVGDAGAAPTAPPAGSTRSSRRSTRRRPRRAHCTIRPARSSAG